MEKAELYRTNVVESGLEMAHGMYWTIWEMYIPSVGIIVNDHGGCFLHNEPRNPIDNKTIEVEISEDFLRSCIDRVESNDSFNKSLKLFELLKIENEAKLKNIAG